MCSYLAAKSSHVGVDVDGLACPLQHPMAYSRQTRGQDFMSGAALSHRAVASGGAFSGGAKPLDLDIRWSVDCMDTYVVEFLHGVYCFYQGTFTLPLQTAIRQILVLEYMLSGVCGVLQPCPILLGNECYHFPRP
jgi:hypothetical protein